MRELRERGAAGLVDFDRARVTPYTVFTCGAGMEFYKEDRLTVSLQFDVQNVLNRRFAYNLGNPISGTHFGPPPPDRGKSATFVRLKVERGKEGCHICKSKVPPCALFGRRFNRGSSPPDGTFQSTNPPPSPSPESRAKKSLMSCLLRLQSSSGPGRLWRLDAPSSALTCLDLRRRRKCWPDIRAMTILKVISSQRPTGIR